MSRIVGKCGVCLRERLGSGKVVVAIGRESLVACAACHSRIVQLIEQIRSSNPDYVPPDATLDMEPTDVPPDATTEGNR